MYESIAKNKTHQFRPASGFQNKCYLRYSNNRITTTASCAHVTAVREYTEQSQNTVFTYTDGLKYPWLLILSTLLMYNYSVWWGVIIMTRWSGVMMSSPIIMALKFENLQFHSIYTTDLCLLAIMYHEAAAGTTLRISDVFCF